MSYRKILEWPNKTLKLKAESLKDFGTLELKNTLIDMEDTLRVEAGVGLAAPQIGESIRAIIVNTAQLNFSNPDNDIQCLEDKNLWILLNPVLSDIEGSQKWEEGCLSVPWHQAFVERGESLTLQYQTFSGELRKIELDWPIAGVVQHECDHLDGKLILDKISRLKSSRIQKSITKKRKKIQALRVAVYEDDDTKVVGRPKRNRSLSVQEIKKRKKIKKNNR